MVKNYPNDGKLLAFVCVNSALEMFPEDLESILVKILSVHKNLSLDMGGTGNFILIGFFS